MFTCLTDCTVRIGWKRRGRGGGWGARDDGLWSISVCSEAPFPQVGRDSGTCMGCCCCKSLRQIRQTKKVFVGTGGRTAVHFPLSSGWEGGQGEQVDLAPSPDGRGGKEDTRQQQDYLSPSQVPKFQACQIPFFLLSPPSLALDCCLASFSPCSLGVPFPSSTCGPSPLIHPPIVPLKRRRERIRACIGTSDDGYATAKVTCIKETLCTQRSGKKGLRIFVSILWAFKVEYGISRLLMTVTTT